MINIKFAASYIEVTILMYSSLLATFNFARVKYKCRYLAEWAEEAIRKLIRYCFMLAIQDW